MGMADFSKWLMNTQFSCSCDYMNLELAKWYIAGGIEYTQKPWLNVLSVVTTILYTLLKQGAPFAWEMHKEGYQIPRILNHKPEVVV